MTEGEWLLMLAVGAAVLFAGRAAASPSGAIPTQAPGGRIGGTPPWSLSQADVVAAVKEGRAEFEFVPLVSATGVHVFRDALKVDGVRVPVTAQTTQVLADFLGCSPTTALLEDMIHEAATVRVVPPTFDYTIMQSDGAVRGFSRQIDEQVAGRAGLVSCVGKSWVLDNLALDHPGKAINYGLITPSAPYASVSGKFRLWQQPSWAHNSEHWDYSQTCRLCKLDPGAKLPYLGTLRAGRLWQ